MRLVVVGSGYVGLVAGLCFVELGHDVTLVDSDSSKVAQLSAGELPIHEEFLPQLMEKHRGTERLHFSDSLEDSIASAQVVFIAVGTPPREDGGADLSYIEEVVRSIARGKRGYLVLVEKSTVPVLTHDWIRKAMLLNDAEPETFDVVSNPEFLREGSAVLDFLYPDRIVIGADNDRSASLVRQIYEPLTSGEYYRRPDGIRCEGTGGSPAKLVVTSAKSAELIKHASNAFLATKISFINAVAAICEYVGADIQEVCAGIGSDSRIGSRFLNPGIGYGGSCFPKDLSAFHAVAEECGYDFDLLEAVRSINEQQRQRFLKKIRDAVWNLKSKRLAVLGLAFKGGTDDIRESPAIAIVRSLLQEGAHITVYDPAAMPRAQAELGDQVKYASSALQACKDAEALLILTEWEEFKQLDLAAIRQAMRYPIIVDGRNLYSLTGMREAGFQYHSVGRPTVVAGEGTRSSKSRKASAPDPEIVA